MKQTFVVTVESDSRLGGIGEAIVAQLGVNRATVKVREVAATPPRGRFAEHVEALEALAAAVRSSLRDMPDHPWIPGMAVRPVVAALEALDGPWVGNGSNPSIPLAVGDLGEPCMVCGDTDCRKGGEHL